MNFQECLNEGDKEIQSWWNKLGDDQREDLQKKHFPKEKIKSIGKDIKKLRKISQAVTDQLMGTKPFRS